MEQNQTGYKPFDPRYAIQPVTKLPVSMAEMRDAVADTLYAEGVGALQQTVEAVRGFLENAGSETFLAISGQDVMVTSALKKPLLVEDFRKRQVRINNSYHARGKEVVVRGTPATSLPRPKGFKRIKWRFFSPAEAQSLFSSEAALKGFYSDDQAGEKQKTGDAKYVINGVSVGTGQYYACIDQKSGRYGIGSYGDRVRRNIADIHVAETYGLSVLEVLLYNGWTPEGMETHAERMKEIARLLEEQFISFGDNGIQDTANLRRLVKEGETLVIGGVEISMQAIQRRIEQQANFRFSEARMRDVIRDIRNGDLIRANIMPYDAMQMEDPNGGSWELWDWGMQFGSDCIQADIPRPLYARDPRLDLLEGGIIGIDFGTKSTVVVCQEDTIRIRPMRVGMGEFDRAPRKSDYENPTVMHFIDIAHFEAAYARGRGRPRTEWKDLTISHTAFEAWKGNDSSQEFFSFFGELKQWAGSPDRQVRLRDRNGFEITLPPYETLPEDAFDPIERYAYFIGLYINNQHTGRIYLEYLLSFPVTYPQKVRERILDSFRRGLRRSLPHTVLSDPACMERFSVEQGAGEPAAYAVCALQEYRISPPEGESILYGVFDFGGGTTDFDFGIWRRAPKTGKGKKNSWLIRHFGGGGDSYLGGENLLELLAFETFKENQNELRGEKIPFACPPHCEPFYGSEGLIYDSQEARTNLRKLMEELRPLWERPEGWEDRYSDGAIKLQLFRRDGSPADGFQLRIDTKRLEALLHERIQKGVNEFFDALLAVFTGDSYRNAEAGKTSGQIHLFLAGNSSKSEILKGLFEQTMETYNQKYNDLLERDGIALDESNDSHFRLFHPLGTEESDRQLQELGLLDGENEERPTGKTGVAIGLVQCRKGSKIKAVSEAAADGEIAFRYWIGDDEDGYFEPYLSRATPYGQWVEYLSAEEDCFEFYYTTNPSADLPQRLPINETTWKHRWHIPKEAVNGDWGIYLRAVGPDEVECVVAESLEAANNQIYRMEPQSLRLTKG